jgi:glucoamylase
MYSIRLRSLFVLLGIWQTGFGSLLEVPALQPRATSSIDSFVAAESPIALQGILNNLGPDGSKAAGAHAGVLVASPFKFNPNCERGHLCLEW